MANRKLKSLKFPGIDDTYILDAGNVNYSDEETYEEGSVGEGLNALKEDIDDLPEYGYVPTAGQMMSDNVTVDTEPYSYRATPYGDREIVDGIVGGTVAFNQLANPTNGTAAGLTRTVDANGVIALSGTASAGYFAGLGSVPILANHIYLSTSTVFANPNNVTFKAGLLNVSSLMDYIGTSKMAKPLSGVTSAIGCEALTTGTSYDGVKFSYYLIDLTQMFGTSVADAIYAMEQSTAGSGVAYLKDVAPKIFAQYNPYNSGELMSVSGLSAHETVGFNQWDEEWEVGGYSSSTGEKNTSSSVMRAKNKIPIIPNASYYLYNAKTGIGAPWYVFYYDSAETFIGSSGGWLYNGTITTPTNASYMTFQANSDYGATYNHDICINLSDPTRNGEYQPYVKHSYALDDSLTLMGVPKWVDGKLQFDGDIYPPSGGVGRNAIELVFDGSSDENWTLQSINDAGIANFGISIYSNMAKNSEDAICNRFIRQTSLISQTTDEGFFISDNATLYIRISSSKTNTVSAFKTWLASNNVEVVYLRQTPTTETAEPYQSVQVCPNGGTEEYISTSIVPVGHSTRYPENSRMKLDGLPLDFSTLIAPTEKAYKATRNYTTGQLLIVNNILYKVTANIANGGTITPNTNVTATTLSEVIASL